MGGPWRKIAPDGPIPCSHPRRRKVARDACNACYQRWKRETNLLAQLTTRPLTSEDRSADARRVVDALCATYSAEAVGYIAAELLARCVMKISQEPPPVAATGGEAEVHL